MLFEHQDISESEHEVKHGIRGVEKTSNNMVMKRIRCTPSNKMNDSMSTSSIGITKKMRFVRVQRSQKEPMYSCWPGAKQKLVSSPVR